MEKMRKLFNSVREIKRKISTVDKKGVLASFYEPNEGALLEEIFNAERIVGIEFSPSYRHFLQICNGWKNFFFELDLLSTNDTIGGTYNDFIGEMINAYLPVMNINMTKSPDWLDIRKCVVFGVNRAQGDLFLFNPAKRQSDGELETVWWYNGVVERRPNFYDFLQMIFEFQNRNYKDLGGTTDI